MKPVPQYCTEIIHRALRFAGLPGARLINPLQKLDVRSPMPNRNDWYERPADEGGSIAVAEGFIPSSMVLYQNSQPYLPQQAREKAQLLKPIHHEWQRTLATVRSRLGFQ